MLIVASHPLQLARDVTGSARTPFGFMVDSIVLNMGTAI
jgi:hypothetical protein